MSYKQKKFDDVAELELEQVEGTKQHEEGKKSFDVGSVGFFEVFKFSDGLDKLLIITGVLFAIASGMAFPFMFFFFGTVTNSFTQYENPLLGTVEEREEILWDGIKTFTTELGILGISLWISHYMFVTCLNYAAERQVLRMRKAFFVAVLNQEIAWYDTHTTTDFASTMSEDLNKIQDGLGEKIGMFIRFFVTFVVAFAISFYQNWVLSLVLCAVVPLLAIMGVIFGKIITSYSKNELKTYSKAGALADEVLSSIRTVVAFGGEHTEVRAYSEELKTALSNGIKRGCVTALTMGLMFGLMYGVYGLGFWYGVKQVMDQEETDSFVECAQKCVDLTTLTVDVECFSSCFDFDPGTIATALFGILQGGMQIGQSSMFAEAFNTARAAAGKIFHIIDRKSLIDSASYEGIHPGKISGQIQLSNVTFNYPSRPDVRILDNVSFTIPSNKSVALVGASGCGKSTCIQLVQRFYDPDQGTVSLDGIDLRTLNVKWLRENVGVVGQEPILFDNTIKENIQFSKPDATDEEIWKACTDANAVEFISKLPAKLDTMVGEGGAQLSGGQKQRIAIARALIRNPKILLLDEATSALDNESEKKVQRALDNVQGGRTTIIVAHRLSTIRNADIIIAFEKGQVKEQGTHSELMELKGVYYNLVMQQVANVDDDLGEGQHANEKLSKQLSITNENDDVVTSVENVTSKKEKKYSNWTLLMKLFKMNSPEIGFIILGIFFSVCMGFVNIGFSILFGDVFSVFAKEPDEARKESQIIALEFGGLALFTFLVMFGQGAMFAISGERLTLRVRTSMFKAMVSQEVGWFDSKENNTGSLCSRLSSSAQTIQSATGNKMGQIAQSISALACGLGLSLYYNWRVGLVGNAFVPLLVISMLYQMVLFTKQGAVQKKALEKSAKIAVEAIKNIRTVAGLTCEQQFYSMYNSELVKPHKKSLRNTHYRGVIFGFANSTFCFAYVAVFLYGGHVYMENYLPEDGRIMEIWKIGVGVLSGAMMVGMSMSFLMDFGEVFAAADATFQLLERHPKIDASPSAGLQIPDINGNISIEDGDFFYPTRLEVQVLRGLRIAIQSGQKIALVGQSGCGKSTVIQLIQRLYDLDNGSLKVETEDIKGLNLPAVRSKIGIVSQEPVLFNRSIAANIKYGDNSREVSMEEVIAAARAANIHNFVASLPDGYETEVGGKGAQLSGGQKQRVAIARALVRNPDILLLDEATSALDSESEKIVQEALDAAQNTMGRTSISIAHRLTTIVGVDVIFVIERGQVTEFGCHEDLMKKRGKYFHLWNTLVTN